MCSAPTYSCPSRWASVRASASAVRTDRVKLNPSMLQVRAALVDLFAVRANQLALPPLERCQATIIARLAGRIVGLGEYRLPAIVDDDTRLDERFRVAGVAHDVR